MNMEHFEMLAMAAAAVDYEVTWNIESYADFSCTSRRGGYIGGARFQENGLGHNPLNDSGLALQLACKLFMQIDINQTRVSVYIQGTNNTITESINDENIEGTVRYAIVKAAAELGVGKRYKDSNRKEYMY
jgi:hypothetical protein